MTTDVPKMYSVADQREWFQRLSDRAVAARTLILAQSIFFVAITGSFTLPEDRHMFGVDGLPVGPAFCAAGIAGILVLILPHGIKHLDPQGTRILVIWLALVGLACVGRTFSVLFDSSDSFTLDQRVKVTGWVVQWLGSVVAIIQVKAAQALRSEL